jgi:hypothetical protein
MGFKEGFAGSCATAVVWQKSVEEKQKCVVFTSVRVLWWKSEVEKGSWLRNLGSADSARRAPANTGNCVFSVVFPRARIYGATDKCRVELTSTALISYQADRLVVYVFQQADGAGAKY